jgi:flagellin-like protein
MNIGKNIRKFRRNARAISPVIATLLMIAIAVVAALVTYAWVMGYMSFQTEKTGQAIQIQSMANSTITDATLNATLATRTTQGATAVNKADGRLIIYLQNVGDAAVNVNAQSVYVNDVQVKTNIAGSTTIQPEATLTIETAYDLVTLGTNSAKVDVKVTTEGGTFSQVSKTFP